MECGYWTLEFSNFKATEFICYSSCCKWETVVTVGGGGGSQKFHGTILIPFHCFKRLWINF